MFISTFENKLDKKGRVSVPASYRINISNEEDNSIICYPSFTLPAIEFCPKKRLDKIIEAMDLLGKKSIKLQPLFITVDPERDTPDILATYVSAFDSRIIGLTGTKDQIKQVSDSYKIYYQKQKADEKDNQNSDYLVNHSAITYLMSDKGQFIIHFSYGTTAQEMAAKLDKIL